MKFKQTCFCCSKLIAITSLNGYLLELPRLRNVRNQEVNGQAKISVIQYLGQILVQIHRNCPRMLKDTFFTVRTERFEIGQKPLAE